MTRKTQRFATMGTHRSCHWGNVYKEGTDEREETEPPRILGNGRGGNRIGRAGKLERMRA